MSKTRWKIGDSHVCPLSGREHVADEDCATYARAHGDQAYATAGPWDVLTPAELDEPDLVNHPPHYTDGPAQCSECGKPIECIDVVQHMSFPVGSAIKYLWRLDRKGDPVEQLRKAVKVIEFEIERRERAS